MQGRLLIGAPRAGIQQQLSQPQLQLLPPQPQLQLLPPQPQLPPLLPQPQLLPNPQPPQLQNRMKRIRMIQIQQLLLLEQNMFVSFPRAVLTAPAVRGYVSREPVRQRKRFPPLSAYTMCFIRRV